MRLIVATMYSAGVTDIGRRLKKANVFWSVIFDKNKYFHYLIEL
jgi:hypothetical protein